MCFSLFFSVFFSSRIRHTRCALVTGVQTCALPITGYGNIATAVAAVKVGATDYLPKPTDADQVESALLERGEILPPPPCNPMSPDRVRWAHIQRVSQFGRASCGESVCYYVLISVVAVASKKTTAKTATSSPS